MYQFLISTQGYTTNVLTELTDKEGNKTGYLSYFYLFKKEILLNK